MRSASSALLGVEKYPFHHILKKGEKQVKEDAKLLKSACHTCTQLMATSMKPKIWQHSLQDTSASNNAPYPALSLNIHHNTEGKPQHDISWRNSAAQTTYKVS